MIIIACADDKLGMLFNRRRQSRDSVVVRRVLHMTEGKKLFTSPYSAGLFKGCKAPQIKVCNDFPEQAETGDFVFAEDWNFTDFQNKIDKIILFRWNRVYPADVFFPFSLDSRQLLESMDFPGSSHERITQEVYIR